MIGNCISANRAYLSSVLRTYTQIPLRRTSDTLNPLYEIPNPAFRNKRYLYRFNLTYERRNHYEK